MSRYRRFGSVPPMSWSATTRTRSYDMMPASLRARSYLMSSPVSRVSKHGYERGAQDYLDHRVTDASFLSSYAMEEGYDTARKSRNRDAQLLRDATDAISRPSSMERGSSSSAVDSIYGPRRFPRRFGRATARKSKSSGSGFYGSRISKEVERVLPFPRPNLGREVAVPSFDDWRSVARKHRARSMSVARSWMDDDVVGLGGIKSRAQSVGPSLLRTSTPSPLSRRASLPPRRASSYLPQYVEDDEPELYSTPPMPLPSRRRYKVVATRRPLVGNYYDRLLRKRRAVSEYLPEAASPLGSDVSRALCRVGAMNDYSGASLVLNIEGTGVNSQGRNVDFSYTPSPIPLFGRTLGVDDRILTSRMNMQPLDSFLSGHVSRMGVLKNELNHFLNRDKLRRNDLGLTLPLAMGPPRPLAVTYLPPLPELYQPGPQRPLVTTVMDVGRGQRLDMIPLGNIKPRLSRADSLKLLLPQGLTSSAGAGLTMFDKINIKAALIASKMDVESFGGRRRPRSDYAARKYRAMRMTDKEHIYMNSPQTSAYYASPPSGPRLTERKAIRTDDGYTKPKNLLSWQPQPAAGPRSKVLSKVVVRRPGMIGREQVITLPYDEVQKRSRFLGAPVKYFPSPYDFPDPRLNVLPRGLVTVSPLPKKHDDEDGDNGGAGERQRSSVKIPNYYACGVDPADPPMSDLRRRIRRTLNKTKRS